MSQETNDTIISHLIVYRFTMILEDDLNGFEPVLIALEMIAFCASSMAALVVFEAFGRE